MRHDANVQAGSQADPRLAATMQQLLRQFLRPIGDRLAHLLAIRLVLTALDLVQAILIHRHTKLGLRLSELGGYLLGPEHAPAGTKRISNLLHAPGWRADAIRAVVWSQTDARVRELQTAGAEGLVVWDGSVWASQASADWCVVCSTKARRLARRRNGLTCPPSGPPILVPGLHWEGMLVLGMTEAPTVADLVWWTTHGPHHHPSGGESAVACPCRHGVGRPLWCAGRRA
ncbi:MAG: hypothetical protein WCG26_05495 [Chloroflexales bacterium]